MVIKTFKNTDFGVKVKSENKPYQKIKIIVIDGRGFLLSGRLVNKSLMVICRF